VDKHNVLQELQKTISFDSADYDYCTNTDAGEIASLSGTNWTVGPLGSYQFKTSASLYLTSCPHYPTVNITWDDYAYTWVYNYTASSDDVYLYYDSDAGTISHIAYDTSTNLWRTISDITLRSSASNTAMDCTIRSDGIGSIWVLAQNGTIQQWWTDTNANQSAWNTGS
jgi:hypothetical protein